jgi:hypothetical protein
LCSLSRFQFSPLLFLSLSLCLSSSLSTLSLHPSLSHSHPQTHSLTLPLPLSRCSFTLLPPPPSPRLYQSFPIRELLQTKRVDIDDSVTSPLEPCIISHIIAFQKILISISSSCCWKSDGRQRLKNRAMIIRLPFNIVFVLYPATSSAKCTINPLMKRSSKRR